MKDVKVLGGNAFKESTYTSTTPQLRAASLLHF